MTKPASCRKIPQKDLQRDGLMSVNSNHKEKNLYSKNVQEKNERSYSSSSSEVQVPYVAVFLERAPLSETKDWI